jgi:hypothetical protein
MSKPLIGTRRTVLVKGVLGAAGLASAGPTFRAWAQAGDKVQPSDPLPQSVKYVENAASAPSNLRKPDSFCNNCQFYQGDRESDSAPCMVLMNKLVPAPGWCSTWTMKDAEASPRRRAR